MKSIPKIVHYCWFGRGKKPALAEKCLASWRKHLPDYEIKEWNEDNFDVNLVPYTAEAYEAKKYAFVSDYARFFVVHKYGGLYFDTDVELIRPIDDIVQRGAFMALEQEADKGLSVAPGLGIAFEKGNAICAEILQAYDGLHFKEADGSLNNVPIDRYVTPVLIRHGLVAGFGILMAEDVSVYPPAYFCPKSSFGELSLTENTRSIHHYAATWYSPRDKFLKWIATHFGVRVMRVVSLFCHSPLYVLRRINKYLRKGV